MLVLFVVLLFSVFGSLPGPASAGVSHLPLRPISVLRFWTSEGLTQHNLKIKGWNSHVHRGFPRKFESTHLSRDNLSREIGRSGRLLATECRAGSSCVGGQMANGKRPLSLSLSLSSSKRGQVRAMGESTAKRMGRGKKVPRPARLRGGAVIMIVVIIIVTTVMIILVSNRNSNSKTVPRLARLRGGAHPQL